MIKFNFKIQLFLIFVYLFIPNCSNENKTNDASNQVVLLLLSSKKDDKDDKTSNQSFLRVFTKGTSTFVLTPKNKLFAFGNNQFGQLGLGDSAARSIKTPTEITNNQLKNKVKNIFPGVNSTFVLTTDNKLFAFGDNRDGALGLGDSAARSIKTPTEITDNKIKGKVKDIVGGEKHTLLSTTDNNLFVFGAYQNGRLGLGASLNKDIKVPTELTDPNIKGKVDKIFTYSSTSFVLTTENKLFGFGSNREGQLGLGDGATSIISIPTEITNNQLKNKVKEVFLSSSATFVLTNDNKLFAFGSNLRNALGLGDSVPLNVRTPTEITDSSIKGKIKKLGAGSNSNFVLTIDNKLFGFGDNRNGRLGLGSDADSISTPTEITDSKIKGKIKDIFVAHDLLYTSIFVLTTDNQLFGFGGNRNGQLGLGDSAASSISTPTLLKFDFLQ